MNIPHQPMFWHQIIAAVVAGTVQLGVQAWMLSNIEDRSARRLHLSTDRGVQYASITVSYCCFMLWFVCSKLICHNGVLWDHSACSRTLSLSFSWLAQRTPIQRTLHKRFGLGMLKHLNFLTTFMGTSSLPPATPLSHVPWVLLC
jgi:hypothetical protein